MTFLQAANSLSRRAVLLLVSCTSPNLFEQFETGGASNIQREVWLLAWPVRTTHAPAGGRARAHVAGLVQPGRSRLQSGRAASAAEAGAPLPPSPPPSLI